MLAEGYAAAARSEVDPQRALRVALSRYNTGHPERGFANGDVGRVEASAERVVPAMRLCSEASVNPTPRPGPGRHLGQDRDRVHASRKPRPMTAFAFRLPSRTFALGPLAGGAVLRGDRDRHQRRRVDDGRRFTARLLRHCRRRGDLLLGGLDRAADHRRQRHLTMEEARLTEDTLFLACTRPAMVWGVPIEAMAVNAMLTSLVFILMKNPLYGVVGVGLHVVFRAFADRVIINREAIEMRGPASSTRSRSSASRVFASWAPTRVANESGMRDEVEPVDRSVQQISRCGVL